jgi:cytochrome oxidase Cu insertion factor (SCO1/SenC/PrrC family)
MNATIGGIGEGGLVLEIRADSGVHHHGSGNGRARVGFALLGLLVLMTAVATLHAEPHGGAAVLESLPQVWRDDTDHSFNLYALRGRPVVLTMAYTTCHRICPMTMQRLQQVQESFDARGIDAEFVIVGYDPENDDPGAWRRYRRNRHLTRPNWHFLVGSPQQVSRFARVLAFDFWKADDHVMHEQRIVYLDPNGALRSDPNPDEL